MTHASHHQVKSETPRGGDPAAESRQSSSQAQMIFVGTLVFIVLSVIAEYVLGEFVGLNIGEDFGVILGGTIAFGIAVGFVASVVHSWNHHPDGT
ncbi:MAG: hypothetical protein AB7F09_02110 [Parvibaculaceae bacterium]